MTTNRDDLIRRLRTTKRGHAKTSKIKWNKLIRHPDDNKQLTGERESRLHATRYGESADERDVRVSTFQAVCGVGVLGIGYDNNRSDPVRQAISYNRVTHAWEPAPMSNSFDRVTQLSNLVRNDTKQTINRHKGGSM